MSENDVVAARARQHLDTAKGFGLPATGPYFLSMAIRDVRCFGAEQTLSLADAAGAPARWTVLLGENGVGKTTILQMLALLAARDTFELERFLDFELYETGAERRPPRERGLPDLARGGRQQGVPPTERPSGGASATFREAGDERRHAVELVEGGRLAGKAPTGEVPFLCGYGANRRLGEGRLRRHWQRAPAVVSLFWDAPLQDAEEWLLQADYAAARGPTEDARRHRELVKELLVRVLPEVSAVRIGKSDFSGYPRVEVETPYGWVPIRGLSLGYQTLIAWMVDLASRFLEFYGDRAEPLGEPAIVLVDEIDLHLHPKWQRQLMGYLTERFPATQFIATAHSPLVVQAAEHANIAVLRRQADHVVIENQPELVRNWRVDQILTSDLYGLPSARPPRLDALLEQRRKLMTKAKLTAADEKKLRALDAAIGDLPGGETPQEQRAMTLILRAAKALKKTAGKRR